MMSRPHEHPSVQEFLENSPLEYLKLRLKKMWTTKTARAKILADIEYLTKLEEQNKLDNLQ